MSSSPTVKLSIFAVIEDVADKILSPDKNFSPLMY